MSVCKQDIIVKKQLAYQFSKAAKRYADNALIQQRIADHLLTKQHLRFENFGTQCKRRNWLDLGCGTGYLLTKMVEGASAKDQFFGIDIAYGMLREAIQTSATHQFINADAESIPLRSSSIDQVMSSMALQWVSSPVKTMQEIARILAVSGHASLAILRDDSLYQLHQGWQYLNQGDRVNQFATRHEWQQAIDSAGMKVVEVEKQSFSTKHDCVIDLLYSIKGIGAGTTIKAGMPPIRKADLAALSQWWLTEHACQGKLALTYTVDFWQLQR